VGGAYLVKALLKKLKVAEVIDRALTHQPEIEASYGQLAEVVITNRLTFTPEPLVHMAAWAAEHGIDRVFGLQAAWLDDDRLGAMLDGLADHQVDVWSGVLPHAVKQFGIELSELHDDTTSVYFEGVYEDEDGNPLGGGERVPLMVEGYNKDGQRHKVQIVLSLIVTHERVPVWYHPWNGNQTDEAVYAVDLAELRQTLLAPANAVLIGDRKLCTRQETLLKFCKQQQRFMGAHPWTDSAKTVWERPRTTGGGRTRLAGRGASVRITRARPKPSARCIGFAKFHSVWSIRKPARCTRCAGFVHTSDQATRDARQRERR
jgi:hypothetical protein